MFALFLPILVTFPNLHYPLAHTDLIIGIECTLFYLLSHYLLLPHYLIF